VTDVTGWRAYILLTETAAVQLGLDLTTMQRGVETYEHLGEVMTFSSDLAQRYRDRVAARQVIVLQEEAHAAITVDVPAPPPIVMEWLNDPAQAPGMGRLQIVSPRWTDGAVWEPTITAYTESRLLRSRRSWTGGPSITTHESPERRVYVNN